MTVGRSVELARKSLWSDVWHWLHHWSWYYPARGHYFIS